MRVLRREFRGENRAASRFCSAKCRKAPWTQKRVDRDSRLRGLVKALANEAGLTAEDLA